MTEKDFRVQQGLVVGDGNIQVNSTGTATVFAKLFDTDVTAARLNLSGTTIQSVGSDSHIGMSLTTKGNGTVTATRIDNTPIGGTTAAAGAFTTLSASSTFTASSTSTLVGAITTGNSTNDTTITQANSAADAVGRSFTITAGSPPSGGTNNTGAGGDLILAAGQGKGTASGGSILLKVADGGASGSNINSLATAVTIADDKAVTFAGTTDFGDNAMSNVNIDSGAIDGTTIGSGTPDAITGTTIDATTDFTVGSTVITDDQIVFTPSANDTVTIAGATNGALNITTVDTAADSANVTMTADGNITLNTLKTSNSGQDAKIAFQYNSVEKVAVRSGAVSGTPVLEVTGNADISGSLVGSSGSAGVTNIVASGYLQTAHVDLIESDGILDLAANKQSVSEMAGTNFYTSEALTITVASTQTVTPGATYYTSGNYSGQGIIKVMVLNVTGTSTQIYQAAETLAVFSHKDNQGTPALTVRTLQKAVGYLNPSGGTESTVIYESGDVELGHFEWVNETDAFGTGQHGLALVWVFTKPASIGAGEIQISCNVNGLSLQGAGG